MKVKLRQFHVQQHENILRDKLNRSEKHTLKTTKLLKEDLNKDIPCSNIPQVDLQMQCNSYKIPAIFFVRQTNGS